MASPPRSRVRTGEYEHERERGRTRSRDRNGLEDCPECEGTAVPRDNSGERVCPECGLVVETTVPKGVFSGKSPTGFAAGALYIACLLCNERRTPEALADATGVTTVTVRDNYKAQIDALGLSAGDGLAKGTRASLHGEDITDD